MEFDNRIQSEAVNPCALILNEGWIGVLDHQSNLHYLKGGRTSALQKFNSSLPYDPYAANCASDDSNTLCFWLESKKRHFLLTYNEAKRGYTNPRPVPALSKPATVSAFSPDGTLLALGDDEGHLWIIHTQSAKALWQLPKCGDAISAVAFNAAGTQVAYASFMRDVTLYDLNTDQSLRRFSYSKDHPVIALRFLHTQAKLLLGTRNNELALYEMDNKRSRSLPTRLGDWPVRIWVDPKDGFALAGDRAGNLYLIALDERQGDAVHLHDFGAPIVDIRAQGGTITVLDRKGRLFQLNHNAHVDRLDRLIEQKDAAGAIVLGRSYPPLRHTQNYGRIKKLFDETAKEAVAAIAKHNLTKAEALLAPYAQEPRFSQPIGALGTFTPKIRAFSEAIEQGRTDQAYAMVTTNGFYKRLEAYGQLEQKFSVQFRAAALLLTGKRPDMIGAKRAVEAFSKIPAKSKILQTLFEYPHLFKTAEDILKKRDFEAFKRLSEKYPILKEAPFYSRYEEEAEAQIALFEAAYDASKPVEALQHSENIVRLFAPFAHKIESRVKSAQVQQAFESAWRERNHLTALSYTQRHPELCAHEHYIPLMRFFSHRLSVAAEHAFALQFDAMHAILGPLMKNRYYKERALIVYQAYYLEELSRIGATLPKTEWPAVLKRFVERFGNPALLGALCVRFGQQEALSQALVYQEKGFAQRPLITSLMAAGF
ncbi:MAG: WD40 repeat domain-containing protein [Campylobacterales bacterium]